MLGQKAMGAAQRPSGATADDVPLRDRSMQILEYLVASIAAIVAIALAFLR
jgi:hypothetical protein